MSPFGIFVVLTSLIVGLDGKHKKDHPPHCTKLTKHTDYGFRFRFDYPLTYIPAGQHEFTQKLYCLKPPTVSVAVTTVCDWAGPPEVQFSLSDEYMRVIRQDPTGMFAGSAVIITSQLCGHNITEDTFDASFFPFVSEAEQ